MPRGIVVLWEICSIGLHHYILQCRKPAGRHPMLTVCGECKKQTYRGDEGILKV